MSTNPDLIAIVLQLTAPADAVLPANLGPAAHGLFLDLLRRADPDLAAALHDPAQAKPFTAASLPQPPRPAGAKAAAGQPVALRFTSIHTGLTALLRQRVLPNLPPTLTLSDIPCAVQGAAADPSAHPWAGQETYEALIQRCLFPAQDQGRRIALRFHTPTTFRTAGHNQPLPLPDLVFGGLAERWNAFSPTPISTEVRDACAGQVAINNFQLTSVMVPFQGHAHVGCQGTCQYVVLGQEDFLGRSLHLLAAYAFYAGVGYRTTMGMGVAFSHIPRLLEQKTMTIGN